MILIGSPFLPRFEVTLKRRILVLIIHPQYKIFCVKLNLRTKFTTPKLLGLIKRVGSLTSKSQLRHSAHSREAESQNPAFMEIDSATAGIKALGRKDKLWMLAKK